MSKAAKPNTTPLPIVTTTGASDVITGDALLIALAAARRTADRAGAAFGEECILHEDGPLRTYLDGHEDAHYHRREVIETAILCIPASGLAGAMIQVEALSNLPVADKVESQAYRLECQQSRDAALSSIFRVLAAHTGRTAADGLDVLVPAHDHLGTDVAAQRAVLREFFTKNGIDPVDVPARRAA